MRLSAEDRKELQNLREELAAVRRDLRIARENLAEANEKVQLTEDVTNLKKKLVDLQIQKDKIVEDNARERRDIEHKVGLEKTRQEQEVALATRESKVEVREENLAADRARFEEQMAFTTKRFEAEATTTRELMSEILKRLPTVTVDKAISLTYGAAAADTDDEEE